VTFRLIEITSNARGACAATVTLSTASTQSDLTPRRHDAKTPFTIRDSSFTIALVLRRPLDAIDDDHIHWPAPGGELEPELLLKLNKVREICNALLGTVGESVVNKHYQKARADLERGAGLEAVEEAINQIARAASILKGPTTTETLLEQLRALK